MKILVTGGAGFIGTNLIKKLLSKGHNVESIDNYDSGLRENEVDVCKYHTGDIESIGLMDKDFDMIYHLAGLSRIQPSFKNPTETLGLTDQRFSILTPRHDIWLMKSSDILPRGTATS
jgi:nucleoside-diphosphate-sugar epimerase